MSSRVDGTIAAVLLACLCTSTNAVVLPHLVSRQWIPTRGALHALVAQEGNVEPGVPVVKDGDGDAIVPAVAEESFASSTTPEDLSSMDFEARLKLLEERNNQLTPIPANSDPFESADGDSLFSDPESQFWRLEFWKLVVEDLKDLQWPSRKQIGQTVFISQVAFVGVAFITLIFDAAVEQGVRALLTDEPFSFSLAKAFMGGK